ncbi:hypothetical protein LCGC14_1958990 [marine sediment metagenome]|uniref:Uncharacterized protein n=1 Tax=marine sediment metagenome TaxID=412755 RepID=A0A0F9IC88_9ZZZZ
MTGVPRVKRRKCFVISPIGKKGTQVRRAADAVLSEIIRAGLVPAGYSVTRADKLSKSGRITDAIVTELATADLVVADLSGFNANVMYELGIRHALNLPAVQIVPEGTKLVFDLSGIKTIFYESPASATRGNSSFGCGQS